MYTCRDKTLCSCGVVQTEEHVICFCAMSQLVRSQSRFVAVEFTRCFECVDVDLYVASAASFCRVTTDLFCFFFHVSFSHLPDIC